MMATVITRTHPLEIVVNTNRFVLTSLRASASALVLGLGLLASAHAQSVDGEVKKIDEATGKVTLKHGEIKNLDMPAMQMSFRVADPAFLKKVQVGDKVTFTADKVGGQFTVTTIDVKK